MTDSDPNCEVTGTSAHVRSLANSGSGVRPQRGQCRAPIQAPQRFPPDSSARPATAAANSGSGRPTAGMGSPGGLGSAGNSSSSNASKNSENSAEPARQRCLATAAQRGGCGQAQKTGPDRDPRWDLEMASQQPREESGLAARIHSRGL